MTKMLGAIAVGAILVMVGMFAWYSYEQPKPQFAELKMYVTNTTYIGNITVNGQPYNVRYAYFNTSLTLNKLAVFQFHDFEVIDSGYPIYNTTSEHSQISIWIPNNITLDLKAVKS